jgi:hypothetical protein
MHEPVIQSRLPARDVCSFNLFVVPIQLHQLCISLTELDISGTSSQDPRSEVGSIVEFRSAD